MKHLVGCAHAHGMKVFLDVITHGVMKDSPLVEEHPDWFLGGSWGMADYDWYGGHAELDEWWVNTWLWYVTEIGVDGFRLDVSHYRNDLWADIRKKAADAGKKIIIIAEMGPAIKGVTDILQYGEIVSHNYGLNRSSRMLYDAAGCCIDRQNRTGERYDVKIYYTDGTTQDSRGITWHQKEKVPEIFWEGIDTERREGVLEVDYTIDIQRKRNGLYLRFPLRIQDGQFLSVQLSCHDGGWVDFPADQNPYAAQGSRYIAGYTSFLAPAVPVFMAGEEFNADYRPLPGLSPNLFGGEPFGKGRWLYGSPSELPVPYYYQNEKNVIIVAANPQTDADTVIRFDLNEILGEKTWSAEILFGTGKEHRAAQPDGMEHQPR